MGQGTRSGQPCPVPRVAGWKVFSSPHLDWMIFCQFGKLKVIGDENVLLRICPYQIVSVSVIHFIISD